ncbi:MAG: cyclopropane-fatty-acyl-phospholipid synthase [Methylotenera sp.]|uniref:cyclopropane-fatty-acyl-phospholipid synthase family protein n=1 Tax=Methylotenera sp. TaxID=2051956 RepID=UPI00248A54EF|nr:cyclopropane-fatty-acyl-phospholipid synthase family protein [Methylotenera sp.]MDI1309662.1 cyclopropane-fatty-acyl-phospholipid synthase [Methylotenera sp.]
MDITNQSTDLLKRLFKSLKGSVKLRLWNGDSLKLGNSSDRLEPTYVLVFKNVKVVNALVLGNDPLRFAEAYFRDDIDVEGDFFAAIKLKDNLYALRISLFEKIQSLFSAGKLYFITQANRIQNLASTSSVDTMVMEAADDLEGTTVRHHTKAENKNAISFHYDVSNEFYKLWLDRNMIYSCAYFTESKVDLNQAQIDKLNHICKKLMLKPEESFLDIGCGWGALIIHAARNFGVKSHGITLSQQQFEYATDRIKRANLQNRVTVELIDYRDLQGEASYDKISSVGMFEHIGLKNLPTYFSTVNRLLKPCGLFLNHGITHFDIGWNKNLSTTFINRYVFPDGQLDTISNIQVQMEKSNFEIADVESLRMHYALTLRHWVSNLEKNHEQALEYVSESTYRIWRTYMAACALEFESGDIGVYQILSSKTHHGQTKLPLTRKHLYI